MGWCLAYLLHNAHCAAKLCAELSAYGAATLRMADKRHLPYTTAVINVRKKQTDQLCSRLSSLAFDPEALSRLSNY